MGQYIQFFSEEVAFKLPNKKRVAEWISLCINKKNKDLGALNFIFCSDLYLLEVNQQYLNHDTFTDVITFNYVSEKTISGDIFISIDRVKENALTMGVDFNEELKRVLIHGVLHLIGYSDKTREEALEIRAQEDFCLNLHPKI